MSCNSQYNQSEEEDDRETHVGSILETMTKREGGSVWMGEIPTAPWHTLVSPFSAKAIFTFSWLKESILFIAVSKAVTISRKLGSCSHRGLDSRSEEILTADLDMAVGSRDMQKKAEKSHIWWDSHTTPHHQGWLLHLQRVGKNQGLQPLRKV